MELDDWPAKLTQLYTQRGWTQKMLAGELGVTPEFLNQVLKGKKQLSPWLKFRYYGLAGWDGTIEQITSLLPDDVAKAVLQNEKRAMTKIGQKAERKADRLQTKARQSKSSDVDPKKS